MRSRLAPRTPACSPASPARRRTRRLWRRTFRSVASASPRRSPTVSSSLRQTKPGSSPATSSTSTAVTLPTEMIHLYPQQEMTHTHQTAPTRFTEANGIRFAYRHFGKPNGMPLVFNQHYTGTMDHWDPAVTDGFAKSREVILFDNAGVSSSSGEVPATFADMGANAVAFIKALGLAKVDVLGFSIGGFVAQEIAPDLVRRLVLVGTAPRGGERMEGGT